MAARKRATIPRELPAPVVRAATGAKHTVLLLEDGAILTLGRNDLGECDVPPSIGKRKVREVAAGWCHTLLLMEDGEAIAFGCNAFGQCNITEALAGKPPKSVRQIAAGGDHSVLLLADGSVVTCPDNVCGQRDVPSLAARVKQVAAGAKHTVLVLEDGTAVAFGSNLYGRCKVPVGTLTKLKKKVACASAGGLQTALLYDDGTLEVFGDNYYGQCDIPPGLAKGTRSRIAQVASGLHHTVVLLEDGNVVAFGSNSSGQCDIPSREIIKGSKVARSSSKRAVRCIAAGDHHTVLILGDGSAMVFGKNECGQCGEQGAGPVWTYTAPALKRAASVVPPAPSLLPAHWTSEDIPQGWTAQPLFPCRDAAPVEVLQRMCKVEQPDELGSGRDAHKYPVRYTNLEICGAWRIEDPHLWMRYSSELGIVDRQLSSLSTSRPVSQHSKLDDLARDLPGPLRQDLNESWFLHGTTPEALLCILNNGLNDRRGRLGAAFGAGIYLCEDVEKADQYALPDPGYETPGLEDLHARLFRAGGHKHPGTDIFYCLVVRGLCGAQLHTTGLARGPRRSIADEKTGAPIFVDETRRELAQVPGSTPPFHHHSLVCEKGHALQRFREFMISDANRVYIEYLIAYRRV